MEDNNRYVIRDAVRLLAVEHLSALGSFYHTTVDHLGWVTVLRIQPSVWGYSFEWDDIKDILMPFVKLLSESYELDDNPINIQCKKKFSLDEGLNVKLNPIVCVDIYIVNK